MAADETRRYQIEVEARSGAVSLAATEELEEAVRIARQVPGVRHVRARPIEIPPLPPAMM